ncbi:uncharacterized protein DMAD_07792 [Drosophila madeirensis]|uniref:Uncharacterized protein n=1 Tax=Drosophila madeirensis TaxID=30013 RepID=A0AAU9F798_DROMD
MHRDLVIPSSPPPPSSSCKSPGSPSGIDNCSVKGNTADAKNIICKLTTSCGCAFMKHYPTGMCADAGCGRAVDGIHPLAESACTLSGTSSAIIDSSIITTEADASIFTEVPEHDNNTHSLYINHILSPPSCGCELD